MGELRMICPTCDVISNRLFESWEAVRQWGSEPITCQVCGATVLVRVEVTALSGARQSA